MSIKKLPTSERPYEKMQMYGTESLSNSELLAVIIKTGTSKKTSVELAQEILSIREDADNLRFLQDVSIEEFMKIKGIGIVKAIQLKAVCELAKRMSRPINKMDIRILNTADVFRLLGDELKFEKREKIKLLILNIKNTLLKIVDISYGGTNQAALEVKDVFTEPIKMGAPKIILVHNHPSGDPTPSNQDVIITKNIYRAGELLGITLVDHVVIGYDKCKSILADRRDMIIR